MNEKVICIDLSNAQPHSENLLKAYFRASNDETIYETPYCFQSEVFTKLVEKQIDEIMAFFSHAGIVLEGEEVDDGTIIYKNKENGKVVFKLIMTDSNRIAKEKENEQQKDKDEENNRIHEYFLNEEWLPAMPLPKVELDKVKKEVAKESGHIGLSKFEYASIAIMAGFELDPPHDLSSQELAELACKRAKALIMEWKKH
jgi:hypothetical protein